MKEIADKNIAGSTQSRRGTCRLCFFGCFVRLSVHISIYFDKDELSSYSWWCSSRLGEFAGFVGLVLRSPQFEGTWLRITTIISCIGPLTGRLNVLRRRVAHPMACSLHRLSICAKIAC